VDLVEGWNLIGTLSTSVSTGSVTTIPAEIIESDFFVYSNSYLPVTTLEPGKGYWIKANQPGTLILNATSKSSKTASTINWTEGLPTLKLRDANDNERVLHYSNTAVPGWNILPPKPPDGVFDVRYSDGTYVETAGEMGVKEIPIEISSGKYPLTIKWENGTGISSLRIDRKEKILHGNGEICIARQSQVILRLAKTPSALLPSEFGLKQNYPNPFNSATLIEYQLPVDCKVRLSVFNTLGQEIQIIVDNAEPAGYESKQWDASSVASGMYFYRVQATPVTGRSNIFTQIRKMMLIK